MDSLSTSINTPTDSQSSGVVISGMLVVFLLLLALALTLGLVGIGDAPLTAPETHTALAAWRDAVPGASGEHLIAQEPLNYWAQRIFFRLFAGGEASSRIMTALAGVALGVLPLLFYDAFGRARVVVFSLMLIFSPSMMAATRLGGAAVWTLLFAGIGLWSLWQARRDVGSKSFWGVLAIVAFGVMALLTEPGGPILALILLVAAAIAVLMTSFAAPLEQDLPGDDVLHEMGDWLRGLPWRDGTLALLLVVVAVSTGFLLYPQGIGMVGEVLQSAFEGFSQSSAVGMPRFAPLITSLFYDTGLWVFAIGTLAFLLQSGLLVTFADRFLIGWIVAGTLVSIIYPGAGTQHALWLVVPLAGLGSLLVARALDLIDAPLFWINDLLDDEETMAMGSRWGKWLLAALTLALLIVAALHFQIASREILTVMDGSLSNYWARISGPMPQPSPLMSVVWFIIAVVFIVIGALLAASLWGNGITLQGGVLGLLGFVLLSGLANGWNLTVARTDDARELWFVEATDDQAVLLQDMLTELAFRGTEDFPLLSIAAVAEDDSLIAWMLRDFPNARFIPDVESGYQDQLVIVPESDIQVPNEPAMRLPELGGSYVGKAFTISNYWSSGWLDGFDILPWWGMRETRVAPQPYQRIVLWVRQDVYDGDIINQ